MRLHLKTYQNQRKIGAGMNKPTEIELLAREYYEGLITFPEIAPELWEYDKKRDALVLSKKKLKEYLNRGK